MKENSIEEDIKLLERFSNENVIYGSTVGMTLEKYKDLQLSAEHILSDYKKLQKENELAKKQVEYDKTHICTPQIIKLNYIPVQEVKDKIEEYKNMLKTCNKVKDIDRIKAINERILELEELLEGRK